MKSLNPAACALPASKLEEMEALAADYDAINLAGGYPTFTPPKALSDRLQEVTHATLNRYATSSGAANFREALTAQFNRLTQMDYHADDNVVVTTGCSEGINVALMTVARPGQKVVVFDPCNPSYVADMTLSGIEPLFVELRAPAFHFDPQKLECACATEGVAAILLNNPHNPSGRVFTQQEVETIASLAQKYDLYVISDESFARIVYAPNTHTSICSLPHMEERTLVLGSLSETFSITGWRLGYIFGPHKVIRVAKRVHRQLVESAAAPLMEAAVAGLMFPQTYYQALQATYTAKRRIFLKGLDALEIPYVIPEGTYFVLCNISGFSMGSDEHFAEECAKKVGVAGVPGSWFFQHPDNRYIRFTFARDDRVLNNALEHLLPARKLLD